jgi:membrane protease YdiL (CAAX protease family)
MNILSLVTDLILAAYIVWETVGFVPRYRRLKQEIADGDRQARTRVYQRILVFEWVSAALALVALRFDWSKLNPKSLALEGTRLMQSLTLPPGAGRGALLGMFSGVVIGGVGFAVALRRRNRRGATPAASEASGWRSRIMPDFTALIPATTNEPLLYAAAAVSAGICEELVFRGWLLSVLHSPIGLTGTALVVVAAAIFGAAHLYQKVAGTILTALAGLLFCALYIATGSLLVPILLHIVIDVRFAFMPAPTAAKPQAAYA